MKLISEAILSPCRSYRYALWRRWGDGPSVLFVMLNPSTADATEDDATIRKCVGYAKRWGYGSLSVANLFAFRATDPRVMMAAIDPVGPDNDETISGLAKEASMIVAAWGKDGSYGGRDKVVLAMLPNTHCLHRNKDGTPGHPLYLRNEATPYPFTP